MNSISVALLGFGNVGQSFIRYILDNNSPVNVRAVADSSGGVVVDSHEQLAALWAQKAGGHNISLIGSPGSVIPPGEFISRLREEKVSCLIESLPTNIETGQPVLRFLTDALTQGINVVTVDKGPVVYGFDQLKQAAETGGARFAFTGTTGVAVPREVASERVLEIRGVLNGTTNYILSEMQERDLSFADALAQAQRDGIAEPNPALDVEGWDTACKILILANALMSAGATLAEVSRIGIGAETQTLIDNGRKTGRIVRLVGRARIWQGRVRVSVAPKLLDESSPFYSVGGTSKAAVFRTGSKGEIVARARSGRDAISQVILEDVLKVTSPR